MKVAVRYARHAGIAALFVAAALLGTLSGVLFAYSDDLPEVSALDNYSPNTITRVLGKDGTARRRVRGRAAHRHSLQRHLPTTCGTRSSPRRIPASSSIRASAFRAWSWRWSATSRRAAGRRAAAPSPSSSRATCSPTRSASRSAIAAGNARSRRRSSRCASRSATRRKRSSPSTPTRSISATAPTASKPRRSCTSGSPPRSSTLEEAATLAGIIQGNVRQSPFVNPEATQRRRNYALERMAEEGFITPRGRRGRQSEKPVVVAGDPTGEGSVAPYFLEEVRKYLEAKYGAKALYESGLTVKTGLDVKLQQAANKAVDRGIRRVDKRRGFRKPRRNVVSEGHTVDAFKLDRWSRRMAPGDIVPAVVRWVEGDVPARVRIGGLNADLNAASLAQWPRKGAIATAQGRRSDRRRAGHDRRRQRRRSCSSRRRSSRARWWRSTITPARCWPWSAATASRAASSIARRRPTGRWDRR